MIRQGEEIRGLGLAFVPLRIGAFSADGMFESKLTDEPPIWIGDKLSKDHQRAVYEKLLTLPWLEPKVRHAVIEVLGMSVRQVKVEVEAARTRTLQSMIDWIAAYMRANGKRKGAREAAIEQVAAMHGISVEGVRRRITRLKSRRTK